MIYCIKNDEKQAIFEEFMRVQGIEFTASEYSYQQVLRSQLELLIEEVRKENRTEKELSILADIENNIEDIVEELWKRDYCIFPQILDVVSDYLGETLIASGHRLSLETYKRFKRRAMKEFKNE